MFIVKKNEAQKEQLNKIFKKVKVLYGTIPPQIEFLGNIDVKYLEEFLESVMRVIKHPNIEPDYFAFIRLHVAYKEEYEYCKIYNSKFLLLRKYTQKQLDSAILDIGNIPFDEAHKTLALHSLKAIYESKNVQRVDFENLYAIGWSQKDIFDSIEHTGSIFKNGRILTAYLKK
jgi:hypothetical protein